MPNLTLALLLALQPPPAEEPPPPPVLVRKPFTVADPPAPLSPPPLVPPPPRGNDYPRPPQQIGGTIVDDDYPAAAIRANAEGTTTVELSVTASGAVDGCTVVRSAGHYALDDATCDILSQRARFSPARDARGRPVKAIVRRVVRWQLPDPVYPAEFVSGQIAVAAPASAGKGCASASSDRRLDRIEQDLCEEAFPPAGEQGAARRPAVALLSLSASAEDPGRAQPSGRLVYREEATFEVARMGVVTGCRQTVTLNLREETAFDLCRYLATEDGPFFMPDFRAPASRPGRMTFDIYETEGPVDPASLFGAREQQPRSGPVPDPPPVPAPQLYVPPPPPRAGPAVPQRLPRPPVHRSGTITAEDYPSGAIRRLEEGSATVRLTVSAEGRVTDCTVVSSSGSAELDATTCTLLSRRARFDPALDAQGRPIPATVTRRVSWDLPADPPVFASGRVAVASPPTPSEYCPAASAPVAMYEIEEGLCTALFRTVGPGMPRALAAHAPRLALLSISASIEEPPAQRIIGRLIYREDARFEVGPDGTVRACSQIVGRNDTEESALDLCRYLAAEGGPFFASDPAAAPRPGRVRLEIYATPAPVDPAAVLRR